MKIVTFTTYPDVNTVLKLLVEKIDEILGNQFIGMYIHGSLALDDFVPDRSDIDLVVVTKTKLQNTLIEKLKLMHEKINLNGMQYAQRMECIYIPITSLRNYSQEKTYFPCLHVGGEFYVDGFGIIEKHVLRERGVVIKGPHPKTFIKPVPPHILKKAATKSLQDWWMPQLKDHSRLAKDDYQVYAILTMCRALYTIKNGDIESKSTAANWAKKMLNKKWSNLIDQALSWNIGNNFDRLEETLDFIEFTLNMLEILKKARK